MIRFFIVLFFLCFTACLKITNIPGEQAADQPIEQPEVPGQLQVRGEAEPNHYSVLVPFPVGCESVQRTEKKWNDSNPSEASTTDLEPLNLPLKVSNGLLIDSQVVAGHHYSYQVGHKDGASYEPGQTYEVHIPLDYLVDKEIVLSKDEMWSRFGRIFFTPSGIITTNGHQLYIQADELISTSGQIRTFLNSENSQVGSAGLSGGNIQIVLRTASGELKIEMRGQNGGPGTLGSTLPADPPLDFSGGMGGGSHGMMRFDGIHTKPGGVGGNGGAGGSSGRYQISISETHTLHLQAVIIEGHGGAGGQGGAPQPIGGWASFLGDKGPDGAAGANGTPESSCLKDPTNQACLSGL